MANALAGLDHVLVAVSDLDASAAMFSRLGFTLSPPGRHPEWGTVNRCLMFGKDYIELLAAKDKGEIADCVRSHIEKRGDGVVRLSIESRDAVKTHAMLTQTGLSLEPVLPLSRILDAPEGMVLPRFLTFDLPSEAMPGVPSFVSQHLTPNLMRRPEWMEHPNGAVGIVSVTALIDNPADQIAAYDRMFGPLSSTPTDDMVTVHTGRSLIFLVTPDGFDHLHPHLDIELPQAPAIVALVVKVKDLDQTAGVLKANGVTCVRKGPHLVVDPPPYRGMGLEFVPA